jgi:hypothetical protein
VARHHLNVSSPLHRDDIAVRAQELRLTREVTEGQPCRPLPGRELRTADHEAVTGLTEQVIAGIADKFEKGTVGIDDQARIIQQHHRATRLLERSPEQLR